MRSQNGVELDLYSVIGELVRNSKKGRTISLRDVTGRRGTDFSNKFNGISGFPDFIIRTRKESNLAEVIGAIEAKYIDIDLDEEEALNQVSGHVESYKNVIYTNGLEWRFYINSKCEKTLIDQWEKIKLGKIINHEVVWESNAEKVWDMLLRALDEIDWDNLVRTKVPFDK